MPSVRLVCCRLLLSASDLTFPSCCGVLLHAWRIASLLTALCRAAQADCANDGKQRLFWLVLLTVSLHATIICLNILSTCIGLRLSILARSACLSRILFLRAALNLLDILLAIFASTLLLDTCLVDATSRWLLLAVCTHWTLLLLGACGLCCLSISPQSEAKLDSKLQLACCARCWYFVLFAY